MSRKVTKLINVSAARFRKSFDQPETGWAENGASCLEYTLPSCGHPIPFR